MSKIQTIKISNFKSITDLEANFNGRPDYDGGEIKYELIEG